MQQNTSQVVMVGCGKMGGALISQWVSVESVQFTIVDPALAQAPPGSRLAAREDLQPGSFDALVVAVKPQMIEDVLPSVTHLLAPEGCVVSIAAGFSMGRFNALLPNTPVIRIMPNLPAAIGQGVSGLAKNAQAETSHVALVEALMGAAGRFIWLDNEDQLDRFTAVAGSGPGYVFEIARTYVEAAKALGFSEEQARDLVLGTLKGTIAMADGSQESLDDLRNSVTSKNGTTEAGLKALNGDGTLTTLMKQTLKAAYDRSIELR
ncbi:MAG: pyrroline-5-carboxylate reductase [Rhodospirillaceae bacterium]